MSGSSEPLHESFMAGRAFFRADKPRAGNSWRRHHRVGRFQTGAGEEKDGDRGGTSGYPPDFLTVIDEPSSKPRVPHDPKFLRKPLDWLRIFTGKIPMKFSGKNRNQRGFAARRYSVGDFPASFLKTRLNCESDWKPQAKAISLTRRSAWRKSVAAFSNRVRATYFT